MIAQRQAELDRLFSKYAGESVAVLSAAINRSEMPQADNDLVAKIVASKQGEKFSKLFDGTWRKLYGSQSEADLAFGCMLAFWCRKDSEQMDRIFRQSKLYRPKWDEKHGQLTYGEMTIQKAIARTDNVYGEVQAPPTKKAISTRAFRLVQAGMIETKAPQWLIRGLIEQDSLALLFGDPGCGKSFWAIDVGLCVATGTFFHGQEVVKQGPVVFVAGEGHNGLKRRMEAWSIANDVSLDNAPLFVSTKPAAITDAEMAKEVQAAIETVSAEHGPPVLIVIDTLARNFGPGDENSTRDMNQFIQGVDALRASSQATVLVVHHTGHGDKARARGAMSLKGALDAEYRLDKDESGVVRLEATKMKDTRFPEPTAYRIEQVPLSLCEGDGAPVYSAVLKSTSYAPAIQKGKSGHGSQQITALAILKHLEGELSSKYLAEGRDPVRARISMDEWKRAMKADGMKQQRVYDVVVSLRKLKMVAEEGGFVSSVSPPL